MTTALVIGALPTLAEFIQRAQQDFGATVHVKKTGVVVDGGPITVRYIQRVQDDGSRRQAVISDNADGTPLTGHVLRSLCTRLAIPPRVFGLHLQDPN